MDRFQWWISARLSPLQGALLAISLAFTAGFALAMAGLGVLYYYHIVH